MFALSERALGTAMAEPTSRSKRPHGHGVFPWPERVVDSLAGAMNWATHGIEQLSGIVGGGHDIMKNILVDRFANRNFTISSMCSGILTPELSAEIFAVAVNKFMAGDGVGIFEVQAVFAVERAGKCQEEILANERGPKHVFADVTSFLSAETRQKLRAIDHTNIDLTRATIMSSDTLSSGWCVRCGRSCMVERASMNVSGTPCVSHTTMPGSKKLGYAGDDNHTFWTYARPPQSLQDVCHCVVCGQYGCVPPVDVIPELVLSLSTTHKLNNAQHAHLWYSTYDLQLCVCVVAGCGREGVCVRVCVHIRGIWRCDVVLVFAAAIVLSMGGAVCNRQHPTD